MQVIRQIVNVKDNLLHVVLPADFKANKVEIIILPFDEQKKMRIPNGFQGQYPKKPPKKLTNTLMKYAPNGKEIFIR